MRALAVAIAMWAVAGCGDDGAAKTEGDVVTLHPDAEPLPGFDACKVVITTNIAVPDAHHVAICTPVTYAQNPPVGGPHWPVWVNYQAYATAVPRELYVHDMEHGGVILAYDCPSGAACDKAVATLKDVAAAAAPADKCVASRLPAQVIVTPDPLLDEPIAAMSWGASYVATCVDAKSLAEFVAAHIGHGTETVCGGNVDPSEIVCAGGVQQTP